MHWGFPCPGSAAGNSCNPGHNVGKRLPEAELGIEWTVGLRDFPALPLRSGRCPAEKGLPAVVSLQRSQWLELLEMGNESQIAKTNPASVC